MASIGKKSRKNKCKQKWIRNIAHAVLPNIKERLVLVPIQIDQMPPSK